MPEGREPRLDGGFENNPEGAFGEAERQNSCPLPQLIHGSPSNHTPRPSGHPKPNDQKQSKYADRSYCDSQQKIDKNLTHAHSIIVPSSGTKRDITIRLVLWCSDSRAVGVKS
jgi:hypothetical protein